jgi:hypothetical protein
MPLMSAIVKCGPQTNSLSVKRASSHAKKCWTRRRPRSASASPAVFAVSAIDNAEHEILVDAYGLTTGLGIVEALVRGKQRGVDVRLIG